MDESALNAIRHSGEFPSEIGAQLRQIAERVREVVWVADTDMERCIYVSPAFEQLWGQSRDNLYADIGTFVNSIHPDDRPRVLAALKSNRNNGDFCEEYRIVRPDGTLRWVRDRAFPMRDSAGQITRVAGIAEDITDRKTAEDALRCSERRYAELVNEIDGIVWEADIQTFQFTFVSRQAERLLGFPADQWISEHDFWPNHMHADDRDETIRYCMESTRRGEPHVFEYRMIAADGRIVWFRDFVNLAIEHGRAVASRGVMVDITDRKQAEEAMRASEKRLRHVLDSLPAAAYTCDADGRINYYNRRALEIWGREPKLNHPDDRYCGSWRLYSPDGAPIRHDECWMAVAIRDGSSINGCEVIIERPNGERRLAAAHISPLHDPSGKLVGAVNVLDDITDRRRVEQELRASEERLRIAIEAAGMSAWSLDPKTGKITSIARAKFWDERVPRPRHDLEDARSFVAPADYELGVVALERAIETGEPFRIEARHQAEEGGIGWTVSQGKLIVGRPGQPPQLFGVTIDITDLKKTEEQLRRQQERFTQLAASAPAAIYMYRRRPDGSHCVPYANLGYEDIFGLRLEDVAEDAAPVVARFHPDDAERVETTTIQSMRSLGLWRCEFRVLNPTRGEIWVEGRSMPTREPDGSVLWCGFLSDITERRGLEEQLRQAQKLEAIGQLAGGVAHDFNNLLSVIGMNCYLLSQALPTDSPLRSHVAVLQQAADRAAGLTRQMLAFSRKQVLKPSLVNLNEVLAQMLELLRRLTGERVALVTELEPALRNTRIDPSQFEQVVLNLVVNARDAVSEEGQVTLRTANVEIEPGSNGAAVDLATGSYVEFSVADTGQGMSPETLRRIFEPFFTTKQMGMGTGLGLPVVHGIVKQSQGGIYVDSAPGRGSTFRVLFPAADHQSNSTATNTSSAVAPAVDAAILVVEDDAALRQVVCTVLGDHGYVVLEASDGEEALALTVDPRVRVDLLLTDMAMPKISGRRLAQIMRQSRRALKVILMSGHLDDEIARAEVAAGQAVFLQKPFTPAELTAAIVRALDGAAPVMAHTAALGLVPLPLFDAIASGSRRRNANVPMVTTLPVVISTRRRARRPNVTMETPLLCHESP